jgi:hypothetical protein
VNAGTWVAIAAAVVAAAGAVYQRWQAVAAKAQVTIMQQQLDDEKADRHEAAGPIFTVTKSTEGYTPARQRVAEIMLTQKDGPGLSDVTVTTQPNENVRGLIGNDGENIVDSIIWKGNAPETIRLLIASLDTKGNGPVNVVLLFESVEIATGATWNRTKTTTPKIPFQVRFPVVPEPQPGS